MSYRKTYRIEFNHCDPAGIVFYPRYFEMTNSLAENFFTDVVGCSYARMFHERLGATPTVHIEIDFKAPSRLGESIDLTLDVIRVGNSSVRFAMRAELEGELRFAGEFVLVWTDLEGRAEAWPAAIREKLEAALKGGAA